MVGVSDFAVGARIYTQSEYDRVREMLEDVWRSYTLLDADQAHLDHSMERVEAFLFPSQAARQGEAPTPHQEKRRSA